MKGCSIQALTGILTEQKFISDCRYSVIESSSLVPVLFREVFSHPYISLFHLLVNGFSVIIIIIIIIHFFAQVFSVCTEVVATLLIPLVTNFPGICALIIGFSFTVWTKKSAKIVRKQVRGCLQNLY